MIAFLEEFVGLISRRAIFDTEEKEAAVETILGELAREIQSFVGVRMHKLGVCEWEVKLWLDSSGQENGAWRLVVTNVTGHTCTVHVRVQVSFFSFQMIYRYVRMQQ